MRRLGKLTLCGIEWPVYQGASSERDALENNFGYCDHQRGEIWIRAGLSPSSHADTLLHEALHAMIEGSGAAQFLKGACPPGADIAEIEETLIRILVPHLRNAIPQLGRVQ